VATEPDDLRAAARSADTTACRPRIGDLISYQNDGKDSTAIAGKVENA
jgi:hypothetical protein